MSRRPEAIGMQVVSAMLGGSPKDWEVHCGPTVSKDELTSGVLEGGSPVGRRRCRPIAVLSQIAAALHRA